MQILSAFGIDFVLFFLLFYFASIPNTAVDFLLATKFGLLSLSKKRFNGSMSQQGTRLCFD